MATLEWRAEGRFELRATIAGEKLDARIRTLDAMTHTCYRQGKYLGSEATLDMAKKRVAANKTKPPVNGVEPGAQKATPVIVKSPVLPVGSKLSIIGAMLRAENGCTREEVLQAMGWTAISMQQQAKALGVELRVDKSRKPFRYYAGG